MNISPGHAMSLGVVDPAVQLAFNDDPLIDAETVRRGGFRAFMKLAWPYVDPRPLIWGWHLDAMADHLEALTKGEIDRLVINVPPSHAKSLVVAVLWPCWRWTMRPSWQAICASYGADLAERDSGKRRRLIESEWYRRTFSTPGKWSLSKDQNTRAAFENTKHGHMVAIGIGGAGTGKRADCIVLDDPLNAMDRYSKAKRDEANRFIGDTASTRFNDMDRSEMVLIMQRLHVEDPTGFVLEGGGWTHLFLPAEFESVRRCITYAKSGIELWRDPRAGDGDLLFPEKFPQKILDDLKKPNALGADGFAGQEQQRPNPKGGGMFKVAAWRFWRESNSPDRSGQRPLIDGQPCDSGPANVVDLDSLDEVLISVDATFKKTKAGSYVAIHVWGRKNQRRLLLDRVHARMDFTETVQALVGVDGSGGIIAKWPQARRKLIEGKANGDAIIATLTNEHHITGIEAVNPGDQSKEQRAHAMQPYHAAGNVELPDDAPWLGEYIGEHAAFPNGSSDDDVDAQSQALQGFEVGRKGPAWLYDGISEGADDGWKR